MSGSTMALALLAHLTGDYIAQSHWMATEKTHRWLPAVLHGLTYAACYLLATRSVLALLVIGGTHVVIDRYRLARHVVWAKNQMAPRRARPGHTPTGYGDDVPALAGGLPAHCGRQHDASGYQCCVGDVAVSDGLFDLDLPPEPEPEPQSAAQRLRARQAAAIATGFHPLGAGLRLHPEASRVLANDGRGADPYRCGSCTFRRLVGGHAKSYPKCMFGRTETPIPEDQQVPNGPKLRIVRPRATNGSATDVKRWWPGCQDWTERQND